MVDHGRARLVSETVALPANFFSSISYFIDGCCVVVVIFSFDSNPFILGGNSSNVPGSKKVPPVVRVKAMATGKSAGYYQPYASSA